MKKSTFLLMFLGVLSSWVTRRFEAPLPSSDRTILSGGMPDENLITQSLFDDKKAGISEENIQRILDGHFNLPQMLRVAVIRLDQTVQQRRYY